MGEDAEGRLLQAVQGKPGALNRRADAMASAGESMQRISRRIRRTLVEGSTEMWTGPGADEARAAFQALADETDARGRTYQEAARPMRAAAGAITRSREDYDSLPDPWGVRANPGLVGDGGFQDADAMDDWVQEQRARLSDLRQQAAAQHYRTYGSSMTAATEDLERTLPRRGGSSAPDVDTSVTTHPPGDHQAPAGNGWDPGRGGRTSTARPLQHVVGGGHGGGFGVLGGSGGSDPDGGWDPVDLGPGDLGEDGPGPWDGPDGPNGTHGSDDATPDGVDGQDGPGPGGLATGIGVGAGAAAVGAVGVGLGLARGRSQQPATPGGLLASAAGSSGDGRGAGGRGGRAGRGGMVPVTGMAGAAPTRSAGRGSGGRGVPVTGAAGARDREGGRPDEHWAVEDDWFGEDESGPPVLR